MRRFVVISLKDSHVDRQHFRFLEFDHIDVNNVGKVIICYLDLYRVIQSCFIYTMNVFVSNCQYENVIKDTFCM